MRRKDLYYSIPLKLDEVMRGKHLEEADVRKSIHQNIRLILKTMSLRYRFDPLYGSVLNKYHARTPPPAEIRAAMAGGNAGANPEKPQGYAPKIRNPA